MARCRGPLLACLLAAAPPAAADILIGVAGPGSGPSAATAADIARGVKFAAERINAEGGIGGEAVAVVEADDNCAASEAEEAARAFVARRVALVVGHPCATAAIAAAPIYAQGGVLFIAPATRHPALTAPRAGATVFRLAGRDGHQGAVAGAYLAREFAGRPVAVVRDDSRFGKELTADVAGALKAAGQGEPLTATIAGAQKDFAQLIAKLAAAQTQALFFAAFPIEGGLLLRQMRAAGVKAVFLGSDALSGAPFAETAGDEAEGAGVLLAHDPARTLAAEPLRSAFPGQPVSGPFLSAYAAGEAWRAAAQRGQSTAAETVAGALQLGAFDTVLGRVSFDAEGNADVPSYDIVWWTDGAWRVRH
jgi:branched-chain amino acid transport system substrate-binding protein